MVDSSTILLVDDEASVRKVLTFPLERDGYTVVQAADGEEALERFEAQPVDLVVLDIMLPKLDGLEVCKRLRATQLGADHHADGPRRRARQGARARARRRRLHHEAVLDPRVPLAREGAPAPGAHAVARRRGRARSRSSPAGSLIDVPRRTVEVRGERAQLTYVEFELLRTLAGAPGAGLQSPDAARGALGHAPTSATRARSTSTSATCARRSRPTRTGPSTILTVRSVGYRFRDDVNPLRSVGGRLALALLVVVAGALGIVYLVVVPSYQQLARSTRGSTGSGMNLQHVVVGHARRST